MPKRKYYLSHGMGVNSTALMLLLLEKEFEFESVFVDHGGDYPETYEYLHYLQKEGYEITVLKTPQTLEAYCMEHRIMPSKVYRWCTDKFKLQIIKKYVEVPCTMFIGIGFNERHRATFEPLKYGINNNYPLVELKIDREQCKQIIKDHELRVPPKSGCWFCPFASPREKIELRYKHFDLWRKKRSMIKNNLERIFEENQKLMIWAKT